MREKYFFIYLILVFMCLFLNIYLAVGDAYLSEEDIYYGADSYEVNYDKEIVTARGNAYFKKEESLLKADKIVIYYAKNVQKAYCYGRVTLINYSNGVRVNAVYGEAEFKEKKYILKGNVRYSKESQNIISDLLTVYSDQGLYIFTGNVIYSDSDYKVTSDSLTVDNFKGVFNGNVKVERSGKDEVIFCKSLEYIFKSDRSYTRIKFKERVYYENRDPENGFVLTGNYIEYSDLDKTYYIIGNAIVMGKDYFIRSNYMKYSESNGRFFADGNVKTSKNGSIVTCGRYEYWSSGSMLRFFNSVRGLISGKRVNLQ